MLKAHLHPILALCVFLSALHVAADTFPADQVEFFEKNIRPLLVERCYDCHGEHKHQNGLRLDSRAAVLRGSDYGSVVLPGKPAESKLIHAVKAQQGMERMPKQGKPLTEQEVALLEKWISMGLPWGAEKTVEAHHTASSKELHWAFQPVKAIGGSIDSLVATKHKEQGLSPAPRAKERDLLRRLYITLTGLPPSFDELQSYLKDTAADKYQHLVDELLSRHQYGERWARVWLDVARYSDTKGYKLGGTDNRFPYSYTYRDWVIQALNSDMPYDEFVRLQLAADHLSLANSPNLAALGFLTLNDQFINDRLLQMDDRIDVISRGLIGLTVACARCHNHKYDPILTKDYYAFYSILNSSEEPEVMPVIGSSIDLEEGKKYAQHRTAIEKKQNDFLQMFHNQIRQPEVIAKYLLFAQKQLPISSANNIKGEASKAGLRAKLAEQWVKFLSTRAGKPDVVMQLWQKWSNLTEKEFPVQVAKEWQTVLKDKSLHAELRRRLAKSLPIKSLAELAQVYAQLFHDSSKKENQSAQAFLAVSQLLARAASPLPNQLAEVEKYFTREDSNTLTQYENELNMLELSSGAPPRAMVMVDKSKPQDVKVMIRGNPNRQGELAPRAWLSHFGGEAFTQGSGRLQLAEKIVSKDNPLTARVIVNRVWLAHFGKPLVSEPSDFGVQTVRPAQHEVLDHLAYGFMQHGWSLKWLHRTMLTSNTWQQSCDTTPAKEEKDPENIWLSRMNRQRLDFESMRDAVLASSHSLDLTPQRGPSIPWTSSQVDSKRSIYLFVDRYEQASVPAMFDFANPNSHSPQRFNTTVPQQSLFLMNSPFMQTHAHKIAQRHKNVPEIYRQLLGRNPKAEELELAKCFIAGQAGKATAHAQLAQVLLMSNEFQFLD